MLVVLLFQLALNLFPILNESKMFGVIFAVARRRQVFCCLCKAHCKLVYIGIAT